MDLSHVYKEGGSGVSRTVVHLLPRTVVVLDSAALNEKQPIRLRWHLAQATEPAADGTFTMPGTAATLSGRVQRLDGEGAWTLNYHAYEAPYNKHRLGAEFKQQNEPYIELKTLDDHCKVLSCFAVTPAGEKPVTWRQHGAGTACSAATPEGLVEVSVEGGKLIVRCDDGKAWAVDLAH